MPNWMNPQGGYDFGAIPGQFGNPFEIAPASLSRNRAATLDQAPAGATMLRAGQVPRGTDQKVNPNAVMAVPPRHQLAQLMAPWQQQQQRQQGFGRGPNYGSQQGSHYGGYSTSGPQSGGAGGMGGWGWGGGARSSATRGGMWGGGL